MTNAPTTTFSPPGRAQTRDKGPDRVIRYRWSLALHGPPERLWPLVADTDRFNRLAGIPAVTEEPLMGADRPLRRRLSLRTLGLNIAWDEAPFEWSEPFWFSVDRLYHSGPLRRITVRADLFPRDRGSTLEYSLTVEPRSFLGALLARWRIGRAGRDRILATFRSFDRALAAAPRADATPRRPDLDLAPAGASLLSPGGVERLTAAESTLRSAGLDASLITKLTDLLRRADDRTLQRLRPYLIADSWAADRRTVLALMLHATRAGLLELRWDVLCPLCRGSKSMAPSLTALSSTAHCDACHIDFTANLDRLVELTFRPSPNIRRVEDAVYCIGGPRMTPHIAAQVLLAPGEARTIELQLNPGRYRLRAREDAPGAAPTGGLLVRAIDGVPSAPVSIDTSVSRWPEGELELPPRTSVRLDHARAQRERLIMLERLDWTDDAATAADVTTLQVFRDLFSTEALRPGEQISVGTLALLFTDLRESTRLYRRLGDAPAFGRVMSHFDVLKQTIAAEGGAIVKTIGDAVMGAFRSPDAALRAGLAAQRQLAQAPEPLALKAAVHAGPCIAVTLNDRLDYFGSTVNLAARLVSLSDGRSVIVSSAAAADPQLQRALSASPPLRARSLEATLKGFDDEVHNVLAVSRGTQTD